MTETPLVPTKPVLAALAGHQPLRPPFWLMRQAGRYLPEYREVRQKVGGFLDLCYNPTLACEVTLQPLRRFAMDGAILFSDILVVPHALGQTVRFSEGEGPLLDPIRSVADLSRLDLDGMLAKAAPIFDTVRLIRAALDQDFPSTTLIGFAGAPWTVACYMVEGSGSREFATVKRWAFADPLGFERLIDLLVDATVLYLKAQIAAGAEVVQLFDSWSGVLPAEDFFRWVVKPARRITSALKQDYPNVPIIGFPRGGGLNLDAYVDEAGVDALSLDPSVHPVLAARSFQPKLAIQGNLDPVILLTGGAAMARSVNVILEALASRPFIFNLGHGIIKETPPQHVAQLAAQLRGD